MQSVRTFFRLALRFCCGQQPEHARPQQLATLPPPVLLLTAAGAVASSRPAVPTLQPAWLPTQRKPYRHFDKDAK